MKKLFFILIVLSVSGTASYAQHCPQASVNITPVVGTVVGLSPLPQDLPCILLGVAVSDTFYFHNFSTVSGFPVTSMTIDTISNLPPGLCWVSNVTNNTFAGGGDGVVYVQGTTTTNPGQYKLHMIVDALVPGLGTFHNLNAQTATGQTYYMRSNCTDSACPTIDTIDGATNAYIAYNSCPTIWTGTVSSHWDTAANWNIGVPNCSINAVIPHTATAPVISAAANAKNLTIEAGASLTINTAITLALCGGLANAGTASLGSGNVLLDGTDSIHGYTSFNNLEIHGTYAIGPNTGDKADVRGILKKTSGSLATADKLTLISNNTQTALIQENGGTLTGNVTMQRYISGSSGYFHLSSPVTNSTVGNWASSFSITGTNGTGAFVSHEEGTLQQYVETNTHASLDSGYYNYTSSVNPLVPCRGYSAILRTMPMTLSTYGTPAAGNISIPITNSGHPGSISGWNLVGNPYPSPVGWLNIIDLNGGAISNTVYIWKSNGGTSGVWTSWNGSTGTNGGNNIIASNQGFFIFTSHASTNLNFQNYQRTTTLNPTFFKTNPTQENEVRIAVSSGAEYDEAVLYTDASAQNADMEPAAPKPPLPDGITSPTIGYYIGGTPYTIHTVSQITQQTVLPLAVHIGSAGTYTISAPALNVNDYPVYLYDGLTNAVYDLSNQSATLTSPGNEDINSRYSVVFSRDAASALSGAGGVSIYGRAGAIQIDRGGDNTPAQITVSNLLGQQIINTTTTNGTVTLPIEMSNAIYLVRVQQGNNETIRKVFVK